MKKSALLVFLAITGLSVMADDTDTYYIPTSSASSFYYDIGGLNSVGESGTNSSDTVNVDFGVNSDIGFNCNSFNPSVSVSNSINDIENGVINIAGSIVSSATSAVISLPMYELQKTDPEMYNILQNGMDLANDKFNTSVASCQKSLDNISNHKSDVQDYVSIADSQGWLQGAKSAKSDPSSVDVNNINNSVASSDGGEGVPWFCGQNQGGSLDKKQHPIKVINDVIRAGYNQYTGSANNLCNEEAPRLEKTSGITRYFKTPQDAQDWGTKILGEVTVTTTSSSKGSEANYSSPGMSLMDWNNNCEVADGSCYNVVEKDLSNIVNSSDPVTKLTNEQLSAVSSNSNAVTPDLISGIRALPSVERSIAITKLARTVSMENTLDKALRIEEMLEGGRSTKVIQNFKFSSKINDALQRMDSQINMLYKSTELRKKLANNTSQVILDNYHQKELNAVSTLGTDSSTPVIDGAKVQDDDSKHYNPDI